MQILFDTLQHCVVNDYSIVCDKININISSKLMYYLLLNLLLVGVP